jgi:L-iditol 2-dehydrogenase
VRAARLVEPGVIEVADVPDPVADGLALLRVGYVGVCGTDSKIVSGAIPVASPRILGHEMVGVIVEAPAGSPHPVGSRVVVDPAVACGHCDLCVGSRPNLCRNGGLLGRDVDGVFAEYVVAPIESLVPVPEGVPDAAAALIQVLGTCVHAVRAVNPFPGQVAVVIGLGVAGQLITQLLSLRGVDVVGITRSRWKRDLAAASGAVAVAHPDMTASVVAEVSGGRGPALVIEAVGTEQTLSEAITIAGIGAEVVAYGTTTGGGQGLPYFELYHKELTIHNPRAALLGDYHDAAALAASGKLALEPIVTDVLELDAAARAFDLVHDPASLKVLMQVGRI